MTIPYGGGLLILGALSFLPFFKTGPIVGKSKSLFFLNLKAVTLHPIFLISNKTLYYIESACVYLFRNSAFKTLTQIKEIYM